MWVIVGSGVRGEDDPGRQGGDDTGIFVPVSISYVGLQVGGLGKVSAAELTVKRPDTAV